MGRLGRERRIWNVNEGTRKILRSSFGPRASLGSVSTSSRACSVGDEEGANNARLAGRRMATQRTQAGWTATEV